MFREVLRRMCTAEFGHEVVGDTGDGTKVVELVERTHPDLVLMDLHIDNISGFDVIEQLRVVRPNLKVLVLSSHCDDFTVFRIEELHLRGYVDKNTNEPATLRAAIEAIGQGKAWFSDTFRRVKAARLANPFSFDKILTPRERAVLSLIGEPLTDHEIAAKLGISVETATKHRFNILKKLGVKTVAELIRYARARGLTMEADGPSPTARPLPPRRA